MKAEPASYLDFQQKNVNIFAEKYMGDKNYIGDFYGYTIRQLCRHIRNINPNEQKDYIIATCVYEWLHTND